MSTTETLDLDSAVDLMIGGDETQEPETNDELTEAEDAQPETDANEDAEIDESEDDGENAEDEYGEDDEDDEAEESDETPIEDLYTVKVDGEEEQVSLEDLKRGYSGNKYVQKGMQQAAELRKEAEATYAALLQERESLAQLLQQAQTGALPQQPKPPSRELFDTDPIGYMEAKLDYDEKLAAYQQSQQQIQQQLQQQSQAEQQARAAYAQQEAQKLMEIVPELKDKKNLMSFRDSVTKAAESYGYTADEIASISSHRDFLVLRDAMRYRELMAGKDNVERKAKKAKAPIKAGVKRSNSKQARVKAQRDKLRRSGSIDDALALMLDPNTLR